MSIKYFLKVDPYKGYGDYTYTIYSAEVSSTEDILNNQSLLNGLFGFSEDETIPNVMFISQLSIQQPSRGFSKKGFLEYYSKQSTLFEELMGIWKDDDDWPYFWIDNSHVETIIHVRDSYQGILDSLRLFWIYTKPVNEVIVC